MDEAHALGADQRLQPRGVAPDRERVFRVQRQGDVAPARRLDLRVRGGRRRWRPAPRRRRARSPAPSRPCRAPPRRRRARAAPAAPRRRRGPLRAGAWARPCGALYLRNRAAAKDASRMRTMDAATGRLDRGDGVALAWARLAGRGPTVVFLPGFASDMSGRQGDRAGRGLRRGAGRRCCASTIPATARGRRVRGRHDRRAGPATRWPRSTG